MEQVDLKRLYSLLEELNDFFHQPENFKNLDNIERFAIQIYPEIKEMYYNTVWSWLPQELQDEFESR